MGQSGDKSTPAYRAPAKCLAPACCLSWGGKGEGGLWPVREWGGWLNDFTSPFQLQQLPIYIVMQIHGLSQMVLFQHRGCIEIWLFIPSTSKVFNAPSSVCFYPFLPWQPFKICAALICLSPAVTERREEKKKERINDNFGERLTRKYLRDYRKAGEKQTKVHKSRNKSR